MNRVESEKRALRYLAIIQQRLRLSVAHNLYEPIYSETVVQEATNAVFKSGLRNLNVDEPNFPAIDLRTEDRKRGIQATRKATASKYNYTLASMRAEMERTTNRLSGLKEVQVVGIECVSNRGLQEWHEPHGLPGIRMRIVSLDHLLRLKEAKLKRLFKVEKVLHRLSVDYGPSLRPDREELKRIVAFIDRPAIHDTRHFEAHWGDMAEAMKDIRRLLSLGADPFGATVTRGWQTFQPPLSGMLKRVYHSTSQISQLLREELRVPGSLTEGQTRLIDGYRLTIQEEITAACRHSKIDPPVW